MLHTNKQTRQKSVPLPVLYTPTLPGTGKSSVSRATNGTFPPLSPIDRSHYSQQISRQRRAVVLPARFPSVLFNSRGHLKFELMFGSTLNFDAVPTSYSSTALLEMISSPLPPGACMHSHENI